MVDAPTIFPSQINSSAESCTTSVYIRRPVKPLSPSPASTALATLPTPDWIGDREAGRPAATSSFRKEMM